jgi:hypothetical protein
MAGTIMAAVISELLATTWPVCGAFKLLAHLASAEWRPGKIYEVGSKFSNDLSN